MSNIHTPTANVDVGLGAHDATASANSASFNSQGYTRVMVLLAYTTAGGAALTAALQECATSNGAYTNVASPLSGAFTNVGASVTNGFQLMNVDLSHREQYLEVAYVVTGTVAVNVFFFGFNPEGANTSLNSTAAAVLSC